ncbi:unnamed protein product [Rodentolepis nana]|uniref:non-specific serine/threonine protein kinase n=1 Tax=Rodentolepis nana TaxID=102285 RepID=A0A0R3T5W1_RODNA|nr:unnamed protein product [Rodentolepis nana]
MSSSTQTKRINFEDFKFDFSGGDIEGKYAIDRPIYEWKSRSFLRVKLFTEDNRDRAENEIRILKKLQGSPYVYKILAYIHGSQVDISLCTNPELLLNYKKYDYAVDMWAAGCILAGSIFQRTRIFSAKEEEKQLLKIANILGGKELIDCIKKYEISVDKGLQRSIRKCQGLGYQYFKKGGCEELITQEAIDLVKKLLVYDHKKRLTAKEALDHPYFSKIREGNLTAIGDTTKDSGVEQLCELINKQMSVTEDDNYPTIDISRKLGHGTQIGYSRKIKILETLKGCPNVNRFLGSVVWDTDTFFLFFEYINATPWHTIYIKLSGEELRNYLRQMFTALEGCHSRGIMHCDIKPNNFLIDHLRRKVYLTDWGLSTFYEGDTFYNTGIGSLPYLSPELLVNYPKYNFSIDIWPMGCIVAEAIFRKRFIFDAGRQDYLLEEILKVLGSECLLKFCRDYHINILPQQVDCRYLGHKRQQWSQFITDENREVATSEAVDLVEKLLVFDPSSPNNLLVAKEDGLVHLFDTSKEGPEGLLKCTYYYYSAHENAIFSVKWVNYGSQFLTGSGDQTIKLFDAESGTCISVYLGHKMSIRSMAIWPLNKKIFASVSRDGSIRIWDLRSQNAIGVGSAFHLQGCHLPVTSNPVRRSRAASRRSATDAHTITSVVFARDYELVTAGSTDGVIKIWDIRKFGPLKKNPPQPLVSLPYKGISKKQCGYSDLIVDSVRSHLFASCMDHNIYKYDLNSTSTRPVMLYTGHVTGSFYIKMSLSPDDSYLATGSADSKAYIYSVDKRVQHPCILSGHQSGEVSVPRWCVHDPTRIVTLSDSGQLFVWQMFPAREYTMPVPGQHAGES